MKVIRLLAINIFVEVKKFQELESQVNPLKEQIQKNYERISQKIFEIKVKDDIYVAYDEGDPIFEL